MTEPTRKEVLEWAQQIYEYEIYEAELELREITRQYEERSSGLRNDIYTRNRILELVADLLNETDS